ncbi:MAG TPA: polysaccharide deacetylase family protein [Firmicutes bacterium]|nr:polysaccharide deacetylase family protein [Bacillota bacterium]
MRGRERGARFRVLVISRSSMLYHVLIFCLILLSALVFTSLDEARRAILGAKPGVQLEGRNVGGMLPDEIRDVVKDIAELKRRSPRDAMFYKESGQVIPEVTGIDIDIDETVRRVLQAAPGEEVQLATFEIVPAITGEHFEPLRAVATDRQDMALTVNVAWGEEHLPRMLDILRENNVRATFFFDGQWVKLYPELVKRIADEGHEIANHGYEHVHVKDVSEAVLRELITKNEEMLNQLTGKAAKLFAPPYGECTDRIVATAGSLGYRTVLWTIDTIDWKKPPAAQIVRKVTEKARPGAIVLMHPTAPTIEALPEIISTLHRRGYWLGTVSDLLARNPS